MITASQIEQATGLTGVKIITDSQGTRMIANEPIPAVVQRSFSVAIAGNDDFLLLTRWRVSKDTIITRLKAKGKLLDLDDILQTMPRETQIEWRDMAWFWSDNQMLLGGCQALGESPAEIMDIDPWLA
jgi:hypothetical protein